MRAFMLTLREFFKLAVWIEVEGDQNLHVKPTKDCEATDTQKAAF